jgi:hypothetical protein
MPLIRDKKFLPDFVGRDSLYSPILPGEDGTQFKIRILTIVPNDDRLAPIEASLSIAALELEGDGADEAYHAISYYWGDINDIESIIIHGSDGGLPGLKFNVPRHQEFDCGSSTVSGQSLREQGTPTTVD